MVLGPPAVAGVQIGFYSCGMFVGLYSPQLLALLPAHCIPDLALAVSGIGSNSPPLPIILGPCNVPQQLLHPKVESVPKLLNLGWPGDLLRSVEQGGNSCVPQPHDTLHTPLSVLESC